MQQKFKYLVVVLLINMMSHLSVAADKKLIDGSDSIQPSNEASRFLTGFTQAVNMKDEKALVSQLDPASLECYNNTKHPELYKTEFDKMTKNKIESLKELRKFKATFDSRKLMKFPVVPTHIAIFNMEEKGVDTQSVELVEKDGKFFLALRCL
jgi:hypothetical protein